AGAGAGGRRRPARGARGRSARTGHPCGPVARHDQRARARHLGGQRHRRVREPTQHHRRAPGRRPAGAPGRRPVSNDKRIPKRISTFLFQSLNSGVTPRVGLDFIVVGRKHEITALLQDLDNVKAGAAAFRVITGRYGSGKSFLLQLMRNYAMERNFVVADADLSPERRLTGTKNQGVATYRELVKNLSSRTRPDGGALKPMLDRWLNTIQNDI